MHARTRLAKSEFSSDTNISVRKSTNFHGSTLHGHGFYELEIITAGTADTVLNGTAHKITRGAIFFISPADFHNYTECASFCLYNIQFTADIVSGSMIEQLVNSKKRLYRPSESRFEELISLVTLMERLILGGLLDTEILARLLESILLLLTHENPEIQASTTSGNRDMQKAVTYIHAHFRENPPLSAVAKTLPLNERYFCKKFKEYTGKTYKEYLKLLKLRYARRLILATSMPLIQISESSGYSTQSHFNREFREYYGFSPTSLRKSGK